MSSATPFPLAVLLALPVQEALPQEALAQERRPVVEVEPEEADLALWRQHLQPTGRELRWESIPWLPTFGEGLLEADREGKPLLLWTMNGHPLGCT